MKNRDQLLHIQVESTRNEREMTSRVHEKTEELDRVRQELVGTGT